MTPFRLSPEARRDIQDIWAYIARDSIEAAGRVRREIRDACRRLAQHPHSGHTLGGYQVIKKWLSYREKELLDRSLTVEEARYVTEMARRIAAILLLSPALDANYRAAKQATSELTKAAEA